jgi:hypothetical protein
MTVTYPGKRAQTIILKTITGGDLVNVNFRLGPFPPDTGSIGVTINKGDKKDYPCLVSGDRAWVWVNVPSIRPGELFVMEAR